MKSFFHRLLYYNKNIYQLGLNTMDYKDTIVCIKYGHYEVAANYTVKEALGDRIHGLTMAQRDKLTSRVAKRLKTSHREMRSLLRGDFSLDQIADETYVETVEQLGLDILDLNL